MSSLGRDRLSFHPPLSVPIESLGDVSGDYSNVTSWWSRCDARPKSWFLIFTALDLTTVEVDIAIAADIYMPIKRPIWI